MVRVPTSSPIEYHHFLQQQHRQLPMISYYKKRSQLLFLLPTACCLLLFHLPRSASSQAHDLTDIESFRTPYRKQQLLHSILVATHNTHEYLLKADQAPSPAPSPGIASTATDLSVLLAFKKSITFDPQGVLNGWNTSVHHCKWFGVICSNRPQHVVGLLLNSKQLEGSITPLLVSLPFLSYLDLSDNSLDGFIPSSIGRLSMLTHFDLSWNKFEGGIPSSLANCSLLEYLDLNNNSLTGGVPPFLVNYTALAYLDLSRNNLGGVIPPNIGLLSKLQFLRLRLSNITGTVPPSITNCTELLWVDLSSNNLKGSLPSDFGKLSNLEVFGIWQNNLVGSIPSQLINCSKLVTLALSQNNLTGSIPPEIGRLARMQTLLLYYNKLTGSIPSSLGNCTNLVDLELAFNNLSGNIPKIIPQLQSLQWLILMGNSELSGVIPENIGNCTELAHLKLASTNISGTLPKSLFQLAKLEELNLASSRFWGPLPANFSNLTMLTHVLLSYNTFEGTIPIQLHELSNLQSLYLAGNKLVGEIPAQLARCSALVELDLSENRLNGSIPTNLGGLNALNKLYLHGNQLTGTIPDSFGNLTRLLNLTLSNNRLSGSIPISLASLQAVALVLNLSHNLFTGPIPPEFGGMIQVQALDLSGNRLIGAIPAALGTCTSLHLLNLAANRLQGKIPGSLVSLKSLQSLDLSENELVGELPSYLQDLSDLSFLNVSNNKLEGPVPDVGVFANLTPASFLGNPGLCGPLLRKACFPDQHEKRTSKVIAIALAFSGAALLAVILCISWRWYNLRMGESVAEIDDDQSEIPRFERPWTLRELDAATDGFSEANIIGTGGMSICFKGILADNTVVAIKTLKFQNTEDARRSLMTELKTLSKLRHRNLVRVQGYCYEFGLKALVLEYMPNGSLDDLLHNTGAPTQKVSWEERLNIALGVAEALVYLHHESPEPVVHCDLKPKNILLDSDGVAHVADFGIARLIGLNQLNAGVSVSRFRGSIGYAAPEFANSVLVSTSADVYSFGVVLLEMLTGIRPTSGDKVAVGVQELGLPSWVRSAWVEGRTREVLDPALADKLGEEEFKEAVHVVNVAIYCTKERPRERPSMKDVRELLMQLKERRSILGQEDSYPRLQSTPKWAEEGTAAAAALSKGKNVAFSDIEVGSNMASAFQLEIPLNSAHQSSFAGAEQNCFPR